MKITRREDANYVEKPEGTKVAYYLFDDYEVHYNDQAPHTTQTWHHHNEVWETIYIIDGQLTAYWRDAGGKEYSQVCLAGDLIETERTPHTFENQSDSIARFLVVKRIPTSQNYRDTLKNDKIVD